MASRPQIPLFYRVLLLWYEPFAAASGAFLAAFMPTVFLDTMTPRAVYDGQYQILFDQIAATYLLFAFIEAVVLRVTSELNVWKAVMVGILLCDAVHIYGTANALGWDVFLEPSLWRIVDWVNIVMLLGMAPVRTALIFEVGFGKEKQN